MPNGVRPVWFETSDTLTRDKTQASIQFDWETKEASGTVNNQEFQETFEEFVFDRVSIQYELMSDLLNNTPSAEYIIFDIDELKTVQVRKYRQSHSESACRRIRSDRPAAPGYRLQTHYDDVVRRRTRLLARRHRAAS